MVPHPHLSRRAHVTANGWAGILIIVLLVAAAVFCILVTLLICKRKRARRQRERKMVEEQSRPFVAQQYTPYESSGAHPEYNPHKSQAVQAYRAPVSQSRVMELETNAPIELQGGLRTDVAATDARNGAQQLDGHPVPVMDAHDVSPIEMPAHTTMR
jgi:flagellar biosynthesis/type III secretory pathway M-ring protein FliF/YscJ